MKENKSVLARLTTRNGCHSSFDHRRLSLFQDCIWYSMASRSNGIVLTGSNYLCVDVQSTINVKYMWRCIKSICCVSSSRNQCGIDLRNSFYTNYYFYNPL